MCGLWSGEGQGDIFWWGIQKLFCLVEHPDLLIRKSLRWVLVLLTVMILKIVIESIFFQNTKFIAYTFKDEKEVANSLMAFNLLKIIHPFQGKKHFKDLVKLQLQSTRIFIWSLIGLDTNFFFFITVNETLYFKIWSPF